MLGAEREAAGRRDADDAGVAGGVFEHLGDVPVGVVVGVDRVVGVGGHPGGAQVAGRGEDRVFGVVGVLDPVAVGVDAVHFPGRLDELHPAHRAGVGGVEVGAEGGLDLIDPGQHGRSLRAEVVGRGRPLVDRDQDRRHAGSRRSSSSGPSRFRRVRGWAAPAFRRFRLRLPASGFGFGFRRRGGHVFGAGFGLRRGAAAALRLGRRGGRSAPTSVSPCWTAGAPVAGVAEIVAGGSCGRRVRGLRGGGGRDQQQCRHRPADQYLSQAFRHQPSASVTCQARASLRRDPFHVEPQLARNPDAAAARR